MNRKQNILLCYFTIAITSLAIFGFMSGAFGKLSGIVFIMIVVSLIGVVTLIVSRDEEGIDLEIFKNKILPLLLIPAYFFLSVIILKPLWNLVALSSEFTAISLFIFFHFYIPIGMAIVFLTSAKNHFNDKIAEHVPFLKRFAFFAITYTTGIVFFPFFLNSWFTKEKKRSLLDDFNDVLNSASVSKSNADINLAIQLAHTELLCEVISKNEISKLANEISIEQIDLSTNDLALVTAMFFFSKAELKESLSDIQFLARLKLQEWIQAKSVNLIVAKMFEDTLYKKFK